MRISELFVYPVKGARGLALDSARLDDFGLEHDRRWMVVDTAGRFVTAREHSRLTLLDTALEADALVVRSRTAGEVRLPLRPVGGDPQRVRIWRDSVDAVDAGDDAAALVTAHLGAAARLVHLPANGVRRVDQEYAMPSDRVAFADGFPILLLSQASLDGLNQRLVQPVPVLRFRPNVVVEGASFHEEDAWRRIRLGEIACDVVKPCARCVVTTIDTATAAAGREPLRTLASYRGWDGKVWFGQNMIHRGTGTVRVGDEVVVLERGEARPPLETAATK